MNCFIENIEQLKQKKECGCGNIVEESLYHYVTMANCGFDLAMENLKKILNKKTEKEEKGGKTT